MKSGCIYVICNEVNKKVYVGKTIRCVSKRLREHRSRLSKGNSRPFYQQLIADKVTDISLEILENNIQEELLEGKEAHYIDVFNSISNGYNYKKGSRLDLPAHEIASLYQKGMTLKAIGEQYGVDREAIKLRVMEAGIPMRSWNQQQYIEGMNKEVLEHLYIAKRMTTYEIGERLGTSSTTVSKRLKQYKILLRPGVNRKYLTTKCNEC